MTDSRTYIRGFLLFGALFTFSSCFKSYEGNINIDGSSTVYPLTEAVSEEFSELNPAIMVTVGVSRTGGGFKKFMRGEIDVATVSRPISSSEVELGKPSGIEFIEI